MFLARASSPFPVPAPASSAAPKTLQLKPATLRFPEARCIGLPKRWYKIHPSLTRRRISRRGGEALSSRARQSRLPQGQQRDAGASKGAGSGNASRTPYIQDMSKMYIYETELCPASFHRGPKPHSASRRAKQQVRRRKGLRDESLGPSWIRSPGATSHVTGFGESENGKLRQQHVDYGVILSDRMAVWSGRPTRLTDTCGTRLPRAISSCFASHNGNSTTPNT